MTSFAAVATEVDIDIGGFRPAGVEKPLEKQVVLQGADVAQPEHVRDSAPQAEPRAEQGMSLAIAKRAKSHTMRK